MARENTQNTQPQNAPDYLAWHVTQKGMLPRSISSRARSSKVRRREKGGGYLPAFFPAILLNLLSKVLMVAPQIV